jgi:nucleoside-diphosphate-sugar epimerase
MVKNILVLGGGGFIGSHLVKKFKNDGHFVRVVDLKYPDFTKSLADEFILGDLRDQKVCDKAFNGGQFDEVYQLAADMGGAGYIFTGENDANIMHNSALINLNVVERCMKHNTKKVFYSSSACMYPAYNQENPDNPKCSEDSAYPAAPDSEYGWEKLFSERLYLAFHRNYGLDVRVARYHNIFGPEGTWNNGKEKAPAALCRKVAMAKNDASIEVWGDGQQTRSFLYIDECVEATCRLMDSNFIGPVNIGSEEMIRINDLAKMTIDISGKNLSVNNISGPVGVRGRNSDNTVYRKNVGWEPSQSLRIGMEKTYNWIKEQVMQEEKKQEEVMSTADLDMRDRFLS